MSHNPKINKKSEQILKKKGRTERIEDSLINYGKQVLEKKAKAKEEEDSKSINAASKECTFRPEIDKM